MNNLEMSVDLKMTFEVSQLLRKINSLKIQSSEFNYVQKITVFFPRSVYLRLENI